MDSQSLTRLGQTSAEGQVRVLEMVLQIIIFSTLVLFAAVSVIIICHSLREEKQPRPGRPYLQATEDENTAIPVSIDLHTGNSGFHSYAKAFSPWYATWARRVFFRSR
jgi:hypothetical protein